MEVFKKEILKLLHKAEPKSKDIPLEVPPDPKLGDFAFPCFQLSKELKKSPADIAKNLSSKFKPNKYIEKVATKGPYLNFFVNKSTLAYNTMDSIFKQKAKYGSSPKKNKKYMVEYFHANTHKAVHIGHVRNISMGESLCRILEFNGIKVYRVNFFGDIGPHVAKCIWGYLNLKEKEPKTHKGIWLGKIYAMANAKSKESKKVEEEIREINNKIYAGDKELTKIWKQTRQYCYDDFEEIYKDFGMKFDRLYAESETEKPGKEIVQQLLKDGIAEESDGAIIVKLEKYDLGVFVVLTSDGNALYSTKDFGLIQLKAKEFDVDKSIHVVGSEQTFYFKQLFKTLELMEHDYHFKSLHLGYGLVMLPEGKMSSREGTVVLYEDLKAKLFDLAKEEILKRHKDLPPKEVEKRTNQIALAALKFSMINREFNKNIVFDWSAALDFEGETGPYVQYVHARICSIKSKYGKQLPKKADFDLLKEPEEQQLISFLAKFPQIIEESSSLFRPHLLARYLLDLSQLFNEFYQKHKVISDDKKLTEARLILIESIRQVIENGLHLLGIDSPVKM